MEQTANSMSFAAAVSALCDRHFACRWNDPASDLKPLHRNHQNGETSGQFIG